MEDKKFATLKVIKARRRLLLRGPVHIFLVVFICWLTIFSFNYFEKCWVKTDYFCPTIEGGNHIFKWVIAITQFFGIGLLLWDLDSRMQTLTGAKLKTYFFDKLKGWYYLWFIRNHNVGAHSEMPMLVSGVAATSYEEQKATIEAQLAYLQKRISETDSRLALESQERKKLEGKLKSDINKVYKAIDESKDKVMETVTKVHVGGYTRQLWSIFFIAYSALLSVYV
ncbi:MAG: hypothetical protein CML20_10205 [Rheinheimera sp.]|uniref:hypothetical protein n=1 Tax=Arsukibacterium sp. UBA3155 TaxID=1946058 RepID=UPI000C8C5071|nr:hypothetical protein [Arsukibacterium sp. UBA3155]MAD75145.1 hypothetical protein [Rheinheimera sp.]